ncbi:hypothetical protein HJG60_009627 [Phyllostomus discolor]|uniref:Uncharacterized protein n=1 Tax=Phyllostomus discolor TaxID=89673 RepID=A0A834DAN3_9CHIR|nr:hypothetical protein HJG60_009627 [Phyllostomus discolor]
MGKSTGGDSKRVFVTCKDLSPETAWSIRGAAPRQKASVGGGRGAQESHSTSQRQLGSRAGTWEAPEGRGKEVEEPRGQRRRPLPEGLSAQRLCLRVSAPEQRSRFVARAGSVSEPPLTESPGVRKPETEGHRARKPPPPPTIPLALEA